LGILGIDGRIILKYIRQVRCLNLTHDTEKGRAFMEAMMNIQFP
jgi:hypothetical protein